MKKQIFQRNCRGCGKRFKTIHDRVFHCSKSCKEINGEKFRKKHKKIIKKAMNRPEVKEKQIMAIIEALHDPKTNKKHKKACKIAQNRTSVKKKILRKLKVFFKTKKGKKACQERSKRMSNVWNNESSRKQRIKAFKKAYKNPKVKKNLSENKLKFWKNEKNADRMFISKYRNYKMPSGKIVKIQGFEDRAITLLLQNFQESDLVIGTKEINKVVGKILYSNKSETHRYYPDIFIKSQNKIIEVKSKWSYNLHKEINELKKQASIDKGFKFEFMILDN